MFKQLAVCAALVGATSTVAIAGDGTNLTKYVADTTSMMLVLDVAGSKNTAVVKEGVAKLLETQQDAKAKLDEVGVDPLRDIDTVAITAGGFSQIENINDSRSMVMIFEGRVPKTASSRLKDSVKTTKDGIDIYTKDDSEIALIDGRLFIAQKGNMAGVIALAKGKSRASLAASPKAKEMRDTLKTAPINSHLWGAILLPKADRDKTVASQMPLNAASFGFRFSSDLEGALRLETPSVTSAEGTLTLLTGALPQVKMMMGGIGLGTAAGTLAVAQDKSAVTASIKVTQTELKSLLALATGQKGGGAPPAAKTPPPPKPSAPPSGGLTGKKP